MLDDFGIVIGLSSYPTLGPPAADLKGPNHDAEAVAAWLREPAPTGGGLPAANVLVLTSDGFESPPNPQPTPADLDKAFTWLDGIASKNEAEGIGRVVGRRLYFYVAGHGFSPSVSQVCLLTGNATPNSMNTNIHPSGWLQWFHDAGYFLETVLWVDCCMDRKVLSAPTAPPLFPIGGGGQPGQRLVVLSAPRPLRAIEQPIAEDQQKWHGIFTWNLLSGLRGAAADTTGRVTGRSLVNWLRQAQLSWLGPNDLTSPDTAKEPEVVTHAEGMVFAREVLPKQFNVQLVFPDAVPVGTQAYLWSGEQLSRGGPFAIAHPSTLLKLRPGLYLVEVPSAKIRCGFVVSRDQIKILASELGEPVASAEGLFPLTIDPQDSTASIRLVDASFETVESALGKLVTRLPRGLFLVRIQIGRQITEKVILLDGPWPSSSTQPAAALLSSLPQIATPIPLPGTRTAQQHHRALIEQLASAKQRGTGAEVLLVARSVSVDGAAGAEPWKGVVLLDGADQVIVDLAVTAQRGPGPDPIGACRIELAPGPYTLQYEAGGKKLAQGLIVSAGFRLEVYVLTTSSPDSRPTISLLMRGLGTPWGTDEDLQFEKARVALADERPVLSEELHQLLVQKFSNPLAGILGGHLLLLDHNRGGAPKLSELNALVEKLRAQVGPNHPDVEALSLSCPDRRLRRTAAVTTAPMFERSWKLLVDATQANPALVPRELWRRVHAARATPPFFTWSQEQDSQAAFRKALRQVIFPKAGAPESFVDPLADAIFATSSRDPNLPNSRGALESLNAADDTALGFAESMLEFAAPPMPGVRPGLAASLGLPASAVQALFDEPD